MIACVSVVGCCVCLNGLPLTSRFCHRSLSACFGATYTPGCRTLLKVFDLIVIIDHVITKLITFYGMVRVPAAALDRGQLFKLHAYMQGTQLHTYLASYFLVARSSCQPMPQHLFFAQSY